MPEQARKSALSGSLRTKVARWWGGYRPWEPEWMDAPFCIKDRLRLAARFLIGKPTYVLPRGEFHIPRTLELPKGSLLMGASTKREGDNG